MNRLLLAADEINAASRVTLTGRRARHLLQVLRVSPGQTLRLGVIDGPIGTGSVEHVETAALTLRVELCAEAEPPWIDLLLAMPRPSFSRELISMEKDGLIRVSGRNIWLMDLHGLACGLYEDCEVD